MENYLPDDCYNSKFHIKTKGIGLHFVSAINVDPDNAFDLQAIWNLLFDLNRAWDTRLYYPMPEMMGRAYASYHSIIGRDGTEWIIVPEGLKAYHAGRSKWLDRHDCNSWMYGIGLAGTLTSGFTNAQYETVAKRSIKLMKEYKFEENAIAGHEQMSPERKKDPGIAIGNFDLNKFHNLLSLGIT